MRDPATISDPGLPRDAYALLAQANLLRMRGRWPDAVEKCMEAMRLAPDNATAQSLLGDIYENQGRTDDAIQWYRMALDVSPDSPADRVKLERLLRAKTLPDTPTVASISSFSSVPRRALPRWQEPDVLLRVAALTASLLVLAIVALAVLASDGRAPRGQAQESRRISAPPVVLPASESPPAAETPVSPSFSPHDPAEQQLLERMQNAGELAGGDLTLTELASDPRASRLTLTLAFKPSAASPTRESVLRAALRGAAAAARETDSQTAATFTIRCLLAPTDGTRALSSPLVFVGDLPRAAVSSVPPDMDSMSPESLTALFQNPWWSPLFPR